MPLGSADLVALAGRMGHRRAHHPVEVDGPAPEALARPIVDLLAAGGAAEGRRGHG